MSERDKSLSGSKFGKGSNIGFSGLKSKQLVQSHLKSIMPSLRGGKNQNDIKYLRVQHEKNLQSQLKTLLDEFCGDYYDCVVFKNTDQILNEEITQQDLFYIFVREQLSAWAQKFARQQIKQSDGKKSISVIQFLKKHQYDQKIQQRQKLIQKNRRDPNEKVIYYINAQGDLKEEMGNGLIQDMDAKLKNKLLREGDKVKTWALANKFKQKKQKRQRLYIYIESALNDKLSQIYKRFRSKNGFKWTQISKFRNFQDLLVNIKKRQDQLAEEAQLVSQMSINPVSKIFDKTQSVIKSMSVLGAGSAFGPMKSVKDLIHDKTQTALRNVDKNFIIHSAQFPEGEKIYQYIMGQKDNNWQRVIYEDKNLPFVNKLVKQIQLNQKQGENDQYMKMINAQTLYIITYQNDYETDNASNSLSNNFNNRYLLGYKDDEQLITLLNQYSRNDDNFTIVVIYQQGGSEDPLVNAFIQKNQITPDNMLVLYKIPNDMNASLSMNSRNSNLSFNDEKKDVDRYLRSIMEDRDRNFNPFQCYADNYVYILYRYDKEHLINQKLRRGIGESARLKKAPYQDSNYLEAFLKGLSRGGDHSIIITEDNNLREAQQVAKKFDKCSIMNVTDRKKVKDEIKVLAWGTQDLITDRVLQIKDKMPVSVRKQYKPIQNQIWLQNPLPRKMPKSIPFREGNNITVKISSQETDPNSQIMQQNLNHYFKQEIRMQNYFKPDQIRLVNKSQEPLTFIICRDDEEELNYMKSIAKQERDDLRQQYILYTKDPNKYAKNLFANDKYERFRFISNSWRKIQEYIINLYQELRGIRNKQNNIYEDQLIHVFYHPQNASLVNDFNTGFRNCQAYPNVRFHQLGQLEWTALQQSPHHLYYILVDEINGPLNTASAINQIKRVKGVLESRKVAPKQLKMLVMKKKTGTTMKEQFAQGTFEGSQQALTFISQTDVKKIKGQILKPHIIIDRNSIDWYYFLQKNADRNRYLYHFVETNQQALKLIENIRSKQVGSSFWYLTSNQKDLARFLESSNNIQQGIRIFGLYHGSQSGITPNKLIFSNPNRDEIEAFILNSHKRSHTIFSPESLRKRAPILATSRLNKERIPINPNQIKKWKQDLGAQEFYFDNISDLKNISQDRNIFLITDANENRNSRKITDALPNVWRIIFDTNQGEREKGHELVNFYPNTRDAYQGFYPAQIGHYLRYLRYNIKNPREKLKLRFPGQLTNIYLQKELYITEQQKNRLLKNNHSIINTWSFEPNRAQLQNAIKHSMQYPNYNNVFILSSGTEALLEQLPNKNKVNYIVFDEGFRNLAMKQTATQLRTDQKPQYVTYIFNLPQNRYNQALNNRNEQLKVLYLDNGKYTNQVNQLRQINRRNNNFTLLPYRDINELAQIRQNIIVLADANSYNQHINSLKYRENIKYFVLGNDSSKYLYADHSKSEYFLAKDNREVNGYFNNLRKLPGLASPLRLPTFDLPALVKKQVNTAGLGPMKFRSGIQLAKLQIQAPLPQPIIPAQTPTPPTPLNIKLANLIDKQPAQLSNARAFLVPDIPMRPLNIKQFDIPEVKKMPIPIPPLPPMPIAEIKPTSPPLTLRLDNAPLISENKFLSKPDLVESMPKKLIKPEAKQRQRMLGIIHPDNKQFKQIVRVLQANLYPKAFTKIETFPYATQYSFENLAKNQDKFRAFDRTIIFITPKIKRYVQQLRSLRDKHRGKLQFFVFDDNFDKSYDQFKQFLNPYLINNHQLPYINREDPKYWLQAKNYIVMVPIQKMKKYRPIISPNISVCSYSQPNDIENQLHRSEQFVIIVCNKKDYYEYKKYVKCSPRCIICIQDNEQLKEDEIPLFRYSRRVLYYGPDAMNYLSKIRIPNKIVPCNPEIMKVLFYNSKIPAEKEYAELEDFQEFEKVPYENAEKLFINLIQNFKNSSNFKVPHTLIAKDLIKLHPKVYTRKSAQFMNKYLKEYSTISLIHEKQFKRSFTQMIKPEQYKHLPTYEYENQKDLRQQLDRQQSPCLIFIDLNSREQGVAKQFKDKHLFIMMYDLYDIWIDRDGNLIDSDKLSRQDLADKQGLFIQMFNNEVFQSYNDMGFYYLSNCYREVEKQVRNIIFMKKEELTQEYKKKPNLLMVIFVQSTDRKFIPQQFYDPVMDVSKQHRVKLIFIHGTYVINDRILYIKFNEIDPVIKHINRVQLSSRSNYCIFPDNRAGNVIWHKFAQLHKSYKPKQYVDISQMDTIASEIRGKCQKVCIICQKKDQPFIRDILLQYSIKTKPKTGEEVFFIHISESDKVSYILQASNVRQRLRSDIKMIDNSDDNNKYQAQIHQVDVKVSSSNARYNNSNIKNGNMSLEDIVQSKNFVIHLKDNLRDSFNVANLYTKGVENFKNYKSINVNLPLNQIIVTNENLNEVKSWVENNPKLFLVYVSDKDTLPEGQEGNTVILKQNQIPKFIKKLQKIQKAEKVSQSGHSSSTNNNTNLNVPNYGLSSSPRISDAVLSPIHVPIERITNGNTNNGNIVYDSLPIKNLQDFKVVKIFYDEGLDKELKKQILFAALKNKNFRPYLFKDIETLKKLMKEEGSLSLLLFSKDPPNLQEQLEKQNYTVIKNKRGKKIIIPKNFNSGIEGLSTILEEDQSQFDSISKQALNEHVDKYLTIMQKTPEKGRRNLLMIRQENQNENMEENNVANQLLPHQDSSKLNLHSNIEGNNDLPSKQWIRQRLDGGVIVFFVDKSIATKFDELKRKYNILIQQYSHSINLNNSIRDKKDKFTIVMVQPNMLDQVRTIKQQYPKTVFILVNQSGAQIPAKDKVNISYEVNSAEEVTQIIAQIYEENEKIKYNQHGKIPSKIDNKRTSYVDNGNSWKLSNGYQNAKIKNVFLYVKQGTNKGLAEKIARNLHNITIIKYKDFADGQKQLTSYSGHQVMLVANDQDIPDFQEHIQKKKDQTFLIRLNPLDDHRQNAKLKKNFLLDAYSQDEIVSFLVQKFGDFTQEKNQERPKEGKSYAPRYQPNTFGTTPRFPSQKDYVPLKNDPIYSSRGIKSISRDSKVLKTEGSQRQLTPKSSSSPYYNR